MWITSCIPDIYNIVNQLYLSKKKGGKGKKKKNEHNGSTDSTELP